MSKPNWKTPLTYNITHTPSYTFQLLSFSQSHFLIYSIMLSSNIKSHLKWRKAIFVGSGLMVEVSSIIKYSNEKQKRTRDTWGMRPDRQLLDGKWSSRQTSTISFLTPESLLLVSFHSNDDLWNMTESNWICPNLIPLRFSIRRIFIAFFSQQPGWRANQSYENEKLFRLSDFTWKKKERQMEKFHSFQFHIKLMDENRLNIIVNLQLEHFIEREWKYLEISLFSISKIKYILIFLLTPCIPSTFYGMKCSFWKQSKKSISSLRWRNEKREYVKKSIETRSTRKHVNNNPTPMKNIREKRKVFLRFDSMTNAQWNHKGIQHEKIEEKKTRLKDEWKWKQERGDDGEGEKKRERPWQILTYNIYFLCFSLFSIFVLSLARCSSTFRRGEVTK